MRMCLGSWRSSKAKHSMASVSKSGHLFVEVQRLSGIETRKLPPVLPARSLRKYEKSRDRQNRVYRHVVLNPPFGKTKYCVQSTSRNHLFDIVEFS